MNILIIGNGFDLAHGLPTKYADFLNFCNKTRIIYINPCDVTYEDYKRIELDTWVISEEIKNILLEAYVNRKERKNTPNYGKYVTPNKFLNEINKLICDNTWFLYFLNNKVLHGENWIDFEKEISMVIQTLDEVFTIIKEGNDINDISKAKNTILINICKAASERKQDVCVNYSSLIKFTNHLDQELGKLIRALEIYIAVFVNKIAISKENIDIKKMNIDHVLSFNYSNTYKRLYCQGKNIECNFIHGEAKINSNENNCSLVLGIDEFLDDDRKKRDLELLSFKKFYQRIYKSTGNLYLNWVDEIKEDYMGQVQQPYYLTNEDEYPNHTLYIFGHSLDTTDKDVLKLFICNDNVQTKIYYHRKNQDDKTELKKLIMNLILIMGPDELIRRTGGFHKTIEFIPQTLEQDA